MNLKKIGNIQIGEKIGSGGFGVIYSGIDTNLNRKVAVKIIDSDLIKDKNILSFFKKEAITQGQMNHPNIVSVYSFDKIDSTNFIIFEFVEGKSLKLILESEHKLGFELCINYLKQILRGLHFAHIRNIVHYDIKPSNIIITNSNIVKITDFGIAQLFGMMSKTKDDQWYGTPIYASPEQLSGISSDFRSDIYSLGITVFEMLTGSLPYDINKYKNREEVFYEQKIKFPANIEKRTKKFIDLFLLKAMKRDVEMRYQNVLEMLEILDNIYELI